MVSGSLSVAEQSHAHANEKQPPEELYAWANPKVLWEIEV